MHAQVEVNGTWSYEEIDFGDLYELDWVLGVDDMRQAVIMRIAEIAIENNVAFDKVRPNYFEGDDSGSELKIYDDDTNKWIGEIAELGWFLQANPSNEEGVYLAYLDNQGWRWSDFGSLRDIDDVFRQEFDGDYEDYAREWMSDMGEGLPDHLESHFDYQSYGEALLDGEEVISWAGQEYIFSE